LASIDGPRFFLKQFIGHLLPLDRSGANPRNPLLSSTLKGSYLRGNMRGGKTVKGRVARMGWAVGGM